MAEYSPETEKRENILASLQSLNSKTCRAIVFYFSAMRIKIFLNGKIVYIIYYTYYKANSGI